jgi:hypothetical protein
MAAKPTKSSNRLPISWLYYLHTGGRLDLSPEAYQRGSVWTLSQRQLLIDSILFGIDIPKFYLRRVVDRQPIEYEVVDGQQRLRSFFSFMNNEFGLADDSDPLEQEELAGKRWASLSTELQLRFSNTNLDVVEFDENYSQDAIEEMFLRLQNGTPLNTPEKRRAIPGTMRTVVAELAAHDFFPKHCGFTDKRFAFEDSVAKLVHLVLAGQMTAISATAIKRTYESNQAIASSHSAPKKVKKALDFLTRSFDLAGQTPKLKKYAVISLGYLAAELHDEYDISKHPKAFAEAYLDFQLQRARNAELPESQQDPELVAYADAARADSIPSLEYRLKLLRNQVIMQIPELAPKDPVRRFSEDQRSAIFRRDLGICQECGVQCEDSNFHADHLVPHSRGGTTSLANGRVLCPDCNWKKTDTMPD